MADIIQWRRDFSSNWTSVNPVLAQGEVGLDFNASMFKIGNGVSSWTQLPYYSSGTGGAGGVAISAGTNSQNTGTIVFSNSNGVTFGLQTDGVLTASVDTFAGGTFAGTQFSGTNISGTVDTNGISLSVSDQTQYFFSNANGVSWTTTNGSVVRGSVYEGYIDLAYSNSFAGTSLFLTNLTGTLNTNGLQLSAAAQSADTNKAGTNFAGTNISGTLNSDGLSLSVAAGGGGADGYNIMAAGTQTANTTGTVLFSNANNVTFGMSNSSVITASASFNQTVDTNKAGTGFTSTSTAGVDIKGTLNTDGVSLAVPNYLTTFNQSVQTQNLHNVSLSGNLTSSGATGYAEVSSGTMTLIGGANITLRQDGNRIEISGHAGGGGGTGNLAAISAGTEAATSGTIVFSNSNGVSFGMNAGTVTASHNGITSQTVQPVAISGSNGSFAFSTLTAGNLNGLSFYTSNGSLVGSYTVPTQSVQTQSTVAIQGSTGDISFSNANGITFGFNASTITASHNGLTTAALSNHSHGNPTLALTNISGTTASNSAGLTLSLSAAAGGGGGAVTVSIGTDTTTAGTLHFDSNYFLLDSGTVFGSVIAAGGAIGAGTQTASTGTVVFSNANNVTFGMSGNSVVTASFVGAGGGITNSFWENQPLGAGDTASFTFNGFNNSVASARLFPMHISAPVAINSMGFYALNSIITTNVAASQSISIYYGIYDSALSIITSNSVSYALSLSGASGSIRWCVSGDNAVSTSSNWTGTAQANSLYGTVGVRRHLLNLGANTFTNGMYIGAILYRGSSVGGNAGINFVPYAFPNTPFVSVGDLGDNATAYSASNLSFMKGNNAFNGRVTLTSTNLPDTYAASQIIQDGTNLPYIMMRT